MARFFEDDTEVTLPTLQATKQKKGEAVKPFVERFRSLALQCSSGMTQMTLVETCRHNLQTTLLAHIGVAECKSWKQLVSQAETIVARIKAEEGEKMRQPSSSQRTPAQSSRSKGKETMAAETTSPVKAQPVRGNAAPGQIRANKQYSFRDEHVVALFKLLQKSNKLKLPEPKRPEEVGKTNDPNYCLYHMMVGHPTKSCYIFKDVLQALIDAEVLKLRLE